MVRPAMVDPSPRPGQRWRVLFLLFFLSGISGLIYESIWSRYIRQFVGSAATAQILVLSLFMGGMSLGALLAGRYIRRVCGEGGRSCLGRPASCPRFRTERAGP